jgi:hypothetical protein
MKREKAILVLTVLCFLLLVGIYIGAYYAWQQYQDLKQQYLGSGTTAGKAGNVLSGLFSLFK